MKPEGRERLESLAPSLLGLGIGALVVAATILGVVTVGTRKVGSLFYELEKEGLVWWVVGPLLVLGVASIIGAVAIGKFLDKS